MKTLIQKLNLLTFILIILFSNFGCNTCENCINNLNKFIGNIFPYSDGEIVEFVNENSIIVKDTVKIKYDSPDGKYGCWGSKEPYYECMGIYEVSFGDFNIYIDQKQNAYHNAVSQYANFNEEPYDLQDTINITFKGIETKVKYYQRRDTIFSGKDYLEFYLTMNNKLLEYHIRDGQKIEKWYSNN